MICERCKNEIELTKKQIEARKSMGLKTNLCVQCFNAVKRRKLQNFPEEILYIKGDKEHPISFDLYDKYKDYFTKYSKIYVSYTCKKCGKQESKQIRKMKTRLYGRDDNLCTGCVISHNSINRPIKPKILQPYQSKLKKAYKKDIFLEEQNILRKVFGKSHALRGLYKGVFFSNCTELDFLYEHNTDIHNCPLFEKYMYNREEFFYRPNIIFKGKIIEIVVSKTKDYNERCFAGMQLAKRNNLKYKVVFKNDIYTEFRGYEDIKMIPTKDLIIFNYPIKWRQDKYYYKNSNIFKSIYQQFKDETNNEKMLENIMFYLREKRSIKWFQNLNNNQKKQEYDKIIQSDQFILYHVLKEKYHVKTEITR